MAFLAYERLGSGHLTDPTTFPGYARRLYYGYCCAEAEDVQNYRGYDSMPVNGTRPRR